MIRSAFALVLLAAASAAQAAAIYAPTPISPSPRTSDYGSADGFGFRSFDNFSSSSGALVQQVSWWGIWFDGNNPDPAPAPDPDVQSWTVAFHASSGGTPGADLLVQTFAAADVTAEFLGSGVLNAGGTYNTQRYRYTVELPTEFLAAAGVEYWVSVMAISSQFYPTFALLGATGGDDESYQQTLGAGMSVTEGGFRAADRMIRLDGELLAVPEPGTAWLAALPLLMLAARRQRRIQRNTSASVSS